MKKNKPKNIFEQLDELSKLFHQEQIKTFEVLIGVNNKSGKKKIKEVRL